MKILGGMVWPEDGNPGFFCAVAHKTRGAEESLEGPREYIEILKEIVSPTPTVLFEGIKSVIRLEGVYADGDTKYQTFIVDYARWRRENRCSVILRVPQISSFEAGVLKIKDYTTSGRILFPADSVIRSQLQVFSKESLRHETEVYGVSALTKVIGAFSRRGHGLPSVDPNPKGWY